MLFSGIDKTHFCEFLELKFLDARFLIKCRRIQILCFTCLKIKMHILNIIFVNTYINKIKSNLLE